MFKSFQLILILALGSVVAHPSLAGHLSSGTFELFFDGNDVGLGGDASEDLVIAMGKAGFMGSFGAAVAERYGVFDEFTIVSTTRPDGLLSPTLEVAAIFRFSEEAPVGSARFQLFVPGGSITAQFRPTRLLVEDATRGDLVLGDGP